MSIARIPAVLLALARPGIAITFWSFWRWHGGWKIAAAVPAALVGFVVLRILVDTARDPTSHNLWPFEILMFGTAALVMTGVLPWPGGSCACRRSALFVLARSLKPEAGRHSHSIVAGGFPEMS